MPSANPGTLNPSDIFKFFSEIILYVKEGCKSIILLGSILRLGLVIDSFEKQLIKLVIPKKGNIVLREIKSSSIHYHSIIININYEKVK